MSTGTARTADIRFIGPVMGRYTLESRIRPSGVQTFALRLQSISPHQMIAAAPVGGDIGETVTAHIVPFGNIRGAISRHLEGGFAVDIDLMPEQRRRLAARIQWYKKRVFSGVTDKREHARFMPREPKSAIVLHDGVVLPCLVIDLSSSGAALSVDYDPKIGEPMAVGRVVGRVVRKFDVGFAIQFIAEYDRDAIEELIRAPDEWEKAMLQQRTRATEEVAAQADALEALAEQLASEAAVEDEGRNQMPAE